MSYGITPTGFVSKDLSTITADLQNKAIEVFGPNTDLRSTNPLMIYINMVSQDIQTQWNILADMYANIFVITASGAALDQLAVDRGIQRQAAIKASGEVTVTAPAGTIIPGGSVFSTSGDTITYFESTGTKGVGETTETFTGVTGPPYNITLNNQAAGSFGTGQVSVQVFPDNKTEVASSPGVGEFTCDYANPSVIELGDDPASAITTVVYYDNASTSDDVAVEARSAGELGNVGPSQINTIVSSIVGATDVTNTASISNGQEEETDPEFRIRLVNVPVAEWTEADLESVVENINGIKAATVDDGEVVEVKVFADQSGSGPYTVDLDVNASDVFRVTHYDDSLSTRTDFKQVSTSPTGAEYRLIINAEPTADQIEYGTAMVSPDTLTVTYMDASVGVGVFNLKVVADAPPLTSTLIDSIESIVSSAKPFGVSFFILEPTFSAIGMVITLVLDGVYSLSDVTPSITSGITAYIDSLDIGDPLRHYRIIDVIMDVTGVVDVSIVQYNVQNEELTRGTGDTDTPIHVMQTISETLVDEDTTVYMKDSDYQLTGNDVDWGITTNSMLYAKSDDGGVFADETTAANEPTDDDMTLFPLTPVVNDAYYFGSKIPFTNLELRISQIGDHTNTILWEYWNGAWVNLATAHNLVDGSNMFRLGGASPVNITFLQPTDWLITTADTADDAYYIRARVSALGTTSTQPLGRQSWIKFTGIDLTGAVAENTPAFVTETTAASNITTNDMTLLPAIPVADDAYYFASDDRFLNLGLTVSTAGSGTWVGVWEYSQGTSSWNALTNVADPSTDFTVAGTHTITFGLPSDWATDTVNSISGKYWVRYRLTTGDPTPVTIPIGRISWVGGRVPVISKKYTISSYDIAADTTVAGQTDVKYTEGSVVLIE